MNKNQINIEYLNWMIGLVYDDRDCEQISFKKLLKYLHNIEFTWTIKNDEHRAKDGIGLRRRFSLQMGYEDNYLSSYLEGPCSMLEMMLALAIRCEETIMDDPSKGDRTRQWFWGMINNLGLGAMTDNVFDRKVVKDVINDFLNHKYERNGKGGLFTVRNIKKDLRRVDIWCQLCWYLDTIT